MNRLKKSLALAGLIPVLASGYMLYESQWLRCREERLPVPDLPRALDGCRVLHISGVDVRDVKNPAPVQSTGKIWNRQPLLPATEPLGLIEHVSRRQHRYQAGQGEALLQPIHPERAAWG